MNRYLEGHPPAVFDHPLDIRRGFGRIPFAESTTDHAGRYHPAGWVLPGGERTNDRERAEYAADRIHTLTFRKH